MAGDFARGGLVGMLRGQGTPLPDWMNRVSDVATSPSFNAALGVAIPATRLPANWRVMPWPDAISYVENNFPNRQWIRGGQRTQGYAVVDTDTGQTPLGVWGRNLADEQAAHAAAEAKAAEMPGFLYPLGGDREARNGFETHIAPHIDEQSFADRYFGGMHNPDISMSSDDGSPSRGKVINFSGPLKQGGREIGQIQRSIYPESGIAKHDYLKLNDQGSDIAKQMLAQQIDIYNRIGIHRVDLYANIDVGAYAWAKYGFLPDDQQWNDLAYNMNSLLKRARGVDPGVRQMAHNLLQSNDPRALWEVADITAPDASGQPLGKTLLLGQDWTGSLDLTDPMSMRRFYDYVSRRK